MPVISGGGGGAGGPATGSYLPVADATGVIVDSTTYSNPLSSGALTALVFPAETAVLAYAVAGDAYPRYVFSAKASDGIYMGDGTVDPTGAGGSSVAAFTAAGAGRLALSGGTSVGSMLLNLVGTNRTTNNSGSPLSLTNGSALSSGAGVPGDGGEVGDLWVRTGSATLILYRCTVAGGFGAATWVPVLTPGSPVGIITSGALSTVQLVTATGAQILTTRDAETITPCTFNPGAATTATVTVALSPDNVTYSTLGIETEPAGVAFDGTIHLVKVRVPAGWYLKLTVNAQAVLGLSTYY